eukprot:6202415-Pleurochrysis_carterae.AAC.2
MIPTNARRQQEMWQTYTITGVALASGTAQCTWVVWSELREKARADLGLAWYYTIPYHDILRSIRPVAWTSHKTLFKQHRKEESDEAQMLRGRQLSYLNFNKDYQVFEMTQCSDLSRLRLLHAASARGGGLSAKPAAPPAASPWQFQPWAAALQQPSLCARPDEHGSEWLATRTQGRAVAESTFPGRL